MSQGTKAVQNERFTDRVPGDLLWHPIALVALALVIANDRILKNAVPGVFTGRLSDFAGLVYFLLFVVSAIEAVRRLLRRRSWCLDHRHVAASSVAVGLAFTLIKTWGPAAEMFRSTLGYALWPAYSMGDLVPGNAPSAIRRFDVIEDRSDLIALIALVAPIWVGRKVMCSSKAKR